MNLKFEQFGGKLSGNYETGQWFKLEQNVNDEWKWLYGELKPGYYRLTKEIDFRESGKFYKELYEVYFAVE